MDKDDEHTTSYTLVIGNAEIVLNGFQSDLEFDVSEPNQRIQELILQDNTFAPPSNLSLLYSAVKTPCGKMIPVIETSFFPVYHNNFFLGNVKCTRKTNHENFSN